MSNYQPTPPPSPYTGSSAGVQKTNVLAIIALILGIVVPIGGIICGPIALSQIKKTGENGRGLALAGLIIGIVFTLLGIIATIAYVALIAAAVNSGQFSTTTP
jgi:peptidyl-prolyl cis-trans isomerase B (cyclophilin B)